MHRYEIFAKYPPVASQRRARILSERLLVCACEYYRQGGLLLHLDNKCDRASSTWSEAPLITCQSVKIDGRQRAVYLDTWVGDRIVHCFLVIKISWMLPAAGKGSTPNSKIARNSEYVYCETFGGLRTTFAGIFCGEKLGRNFSVN